MKKILILFAALLGMATSQAQQSGGDCFEGLSRKIGFSQMIPPHGLEITYDKTVHVIFPAPVKYVDLGSTDLLAGKGRRCGERDPREGRHEAFQAGDEHERDNGRRELLQLQCKVRRRAAAAECRDVRLHP